MRCAPSAASGSRATRTSTDLRNGRAGTEPDASRAVEVIGIGPRVVLVHGSVTNARWLWRQQRVLAESFTLVLPNRGGYPPNPRLDYIDFEQQADELADLLDDGTHLVGFSYGAVVSLLAAGRRIDALRSLTVIEPPAFWLARGVPEVDRLALEIFKLFWSGPADPRAFVEEFMPLLGGKLKLPPQLPPEIEQGIRALMVERPPWDARFALDELKRAPFPKLVVSGAHNPALDAVCDVLEERLGAERVVVAADGHNIPYAGAPFNEALAAFLRRAEAAS
jgi:pimeloyl-ACP methyl ester carboxylesterase